MVKNDEWVNKKTERAIASGASIRAEIETPLRMVLIFDI
jgi:DNA-directed RNA polymerase subunit E'/Rpb7